ncbi:MAG: hypothetical protein GC205_05405 [Bacteroidetes bacterium]|nr:hypothetical protein [Bacteroidota bacterium]
MTRVFLVGTARAGTTLLQGMLGSHPLVYTLPETHFLDKSLPKQPWLRIFRVLGEGDRQRVAAFLATLQASELARLLPEGRIYDKQRWTRALLAILDELAARQQKTLWLEKTPLHLYYTDLLLATDPAIRIVHLLRDPVDNIASLVDAGQKHAEAFRQNSLQKATARWVKEYKMQAALVGQAGHYFVRYERLVDSPEAVLRGALAFLGLDWNPAVLDFGRRAADITTASETWKDRNSAELARSGKAERILSEQNWRWIMDRTKQYGMGIFEQTSPS